MRHLSPGHQAGAQTERVTVLLVEDEPELLDIFASFLREQDFLVLEANNGYEALLEFDRIGADVVVTDLHMPGLDGLALLRALKRRDPFVEVIVLTGDSSVDAAIAAMRVDGAFDFLIKPLARIDRLTEVLQLAAERRRQARSQAHDRMRSEQIRTIALELTGAGNAEERLTEAIKQGCGLFGVTSSTLHLADDRGSWSLALAVGLNRTQWLVSPRPRHRALADEVLRTNQANFSEDSVLLAPKSAGMSGSGSPLCAVVPLQAGSRKLGVWCLAGDHGKTIALEDRVWMQRLADHVALAFNGVLEWRQQARRAQDALRMALTDQLTSLANRRGFEEFLTARLDEARQSGMPCAVVLIDLDDLKLYNDTYGHVVGDRALIAVANALMKTVRLGDLGARVGGDEFAAVCPGADLNGAEAMATRLRAAISSEEPPVGDVPASAAIGVASFPHDGDTVAELVGAADARLYLEKHAPSRKKSWPATPGSEQARATAG